MGDDDKSDGVLGAVVALLVLLLVAGGIGGWLFVRTQTARSAAMREMEAARYAEQRARAATEAQQGKGDE